MTTIILPKRGRGIGLRGGGSIHYSFFSFKMWFEVVDQVGGLLCFVSVPFQWGSIIHYSVFNLGQYAVGQVGWGEKHIRGCQLFNIHSSITQILLKNVWGGILQYSFFDVGSGSMFVKMGTVGYPSSQIYPYMEGQLFNINSSVQYIDYGWGGGGF